MGKEKGRYAVQFTRDGTKKLLKPENLEAARAGADRLRELFTSKPETTAKLQRLMQSGDLGFARFDDASLRGLLRDLIEAGYWAEDSDTEKHVSKSIELAEHPSGPDAIKIIRRLESADEDYIGKILEEVGPRVKSDAGLSHIFDELKAMGSHFEF